MRVRIPPRPRQTRGQAGLRIALCPQGDEGPVGGLARFVQVEGRRPSFVQAAPPDQAEPLVPAVVDRLAELGVITAAGRSRAPMAVTLVNDGPFTVLLET